MSAMPIEGQEDDDFAYEDEHIEMESDNQEYGDLDEREFDSRSTLIRAELISPGGVGHVAPSPEPQRPPGEPGSAPKNPQTLAHPVPAPPNVPAPDAQPAQLAPPASKVKRRSKKAAARARPPAKAHSRSPAKRGASSRANKPTKPVRKTAAKPAKKSAAKKAVPVKRRSAVKKKAAPKTTKRTKRSLPTLTRKRRA